MGAQFSKTAGKGETAAEKPGEAAASPSKANGQVNPGHLLREVMSVWCLLGEFCWSPASSKHTN